MSNIQCTTKKWIDAKTGRLGQTKLKTKTMVPSAISITKVLQSSLRKSNPFFLFEENPRGGGGT